MTRETHRPDTFVKRVLLVRLTVIAMIIAAVLCFWVYVKAIENLRELALLTGLLVMEIVAIETDHRMRLEGTDQEASLQQTLQDWIDADRRPREYLVQGDLDLGRVVFARLGGSDFARPVEARADALPANANTFIDALPASADLSQRERFVLKRFGGAPYPSGRESLLWPTCSTP